MKLWIIDEHGNCIVIDEMTDYGTDGHRYIRDPKDERFMLRVTLDGEVLGQFDKHVED